jgi:hypothetical protein
MIGGDERLGREVGVSEWPEAVLQDAAGYPRR